ncbi:glycine zipper 2TM domain-containing protein [Deefgea rivuli]|uniref:glycine zipper 2TM domain-containing protein n=1 Tax=Deefgea rivuli TaxID=400948 RepID=UPI000684ECB3|nr:glycine zipper 2TM domain-containing protein [Deefgea rivuli]
MSNTSNTPHPLILAAAGSVILASGVGIANWFGLIGQATPIASAPIVVISATATPSPTLTPSPSPTATPTATPTIKPTSAPTQKPKPKPTLHAVVTSNPVNLITPMPVPIKPICQNCGRIVNIQAIEVAGEGGPGGVILGGAAGGLLGNQIGKGRGKTLATIAGVVGGAVIGTQVEKQIKKETHYDVTTQFDDGSTRTIQYPQAPALQIGQRVRLVNGTLMADN